MEGRLGNFAQARSLFTAGLQIDPRNAPCWKSWIQMEQVAELFDRADALRAYRDEAYRKMALPPSFSTLPGAPEQGTVMQTVIEWMTKERRIRPRLSENNPSASNPGSPTPLQGAALAESVAGAASVADAGRSTLMQQPPAGRTRPGWRRRPSDRSDPGFSELPKQGSGETLGPGRRSERVWPEALQRPSADAPKQPPHRDMRRLMRTEGGTEGGSMQQEPGAVVRRNVGALSGENVTDPAEVELGSLTVRKDGDDDASGLAQTRGAGDVVEGQVNSKGVADEQQLAQWEALKRAVGGRSIDDLEVKPQDGADTEVAASQDAIR